MMQTYHIYLFDYANHTNGRAPSIDAENLSDLRLRLIKKYLKPKGITDMVIQVEITKSPKGMRYVDLIGIMEIQSMLDSVRWQTFGKQTWRKVSKNTGRLM